MNERIIYYIMNEDGDEDQFCDMKTEEISKKLLDEFHDYHTTYGCDGFLSDGTDKNMINLKVENRLNEIANKVHTTKKICSVAVCDENVDDITKRIENDVNFIRWI